MSKNYSYKAKVPVSVSSEVGRLRRVLVHSPDSGLGKVVPSKAQDWLFEDIVHLDTIRRKEYDFYTKILLYFLDPAKIRGRLAEVDDTVNRRAFYKPGNDQFFRSDKVVELQWLLADILADDAIKMKLVASVCAIEACSYETQQDLQELDPVQLAKTFISGATNDDRLLFAPIPNFIFTRDIGIVVNNYVLLNKPAKKARTREALLAKYIFFNHPLFREYQENIIELTDTHHHFLLPREGDDHKVTLEGGDVMVVSKDHILIGISERTSPQAAHQAIQVLFEKNVVKKVTIIRIPKKRDFMHIDTIFTQVKRNVWILLGTFSNKAIKHEDSDEIQRILDSNKKEEKLRIIQFRKKDPDNPEYSTAWKTSSPTSAKTTSNAPRRHSSSTRETTSSLSTPGNNGRIPATCWPSKKAWSWVMTATTRQWMPLKTPASTLSPPESSSTGSSRERSTPTNSRIP